MALVDARNRQTGDPQAIVIASQMDVFLPAQIDILPEAGALIVIQTKVEIDTKEVSLQKLSHFYYYINHMLLYDKK